MAKNIIDTGHDKLLFMSLVIYVACVFIFFDIGATQNEKMRAHKINQSQNGPHVEPARKTHGVEDKDEAQRKIEKILHDIEEPIRDILLQRKKILANEDGSLVCVEYLLDDSVAGTGLEYAVYSNEGLRRGAKNWNKHCINSSLKDYTALRSSMQINLSELPFTCQESKGVA